MLGGLAAADETIAPAVPEPARCVTVRPLSCVAPVRVQAGGEHGFSRAPRAPYVTDSGVLVLEYLLPPKARRGVWTFMQELVFVKANGSSMLMTSYRLSSSSPEGSALSIDGRWDMIRRYETDTPFSFRSGKRVLRFTMGGKDGESIERCEYAEIDGQETLSPFTPLYPRPENNGDKAPFGTYGGFWGK